MNLNRRQFMASSCAAALFPKIANAQTPAEILEARVGEIDLVEGDFPKTGIWGYNGGVPGPEIRVPQGTRLRRKLVNSLPQPTSIHWHGLRIDNAMDGVPGLTQGAVAKGQTFDYEFTLPDAGTFWYHSHNKSTEQVARGLYGVLIAEEAEAPEVDHDIVVAIDDWRLTDKAQLDTDFNRPGDWTHGGRRGNFVHARLMPEVEKISRNQRLRLRFVNVATDRIMLIGLYGLTGSVVAFDGMPLLTPQEQRTMVLGPAQRVDMIVDVSGDVGGKAGVAILEGEQWLALTSFDVITEESQTTRGEINALPPNPATRLNSLSEARNVPLNMEGGAMSGLQKGIYKGKEMSTDELIDNGQIWTFNGVAGLGDAPLATASLGETLRIPIQNNTAFPHAMHLHGHHFQEVLKDGSFGPLRDTVMIDSGETREIAFLADNPGDWLFHCHMLSHQAAGMKTWIKVAT